MTPVRAVVFDPAGARPDWLPVGLPCIGDLRQLMPLLDAVE
jgi:hypothetical protein